MIYKELRKDGFDLADGRYRELKPILDEVNKINDQHLKRSIEYMISSG